MPAGMDSETSDSAHTPFGYVFERPVIVSVRDIANPRGAPLVVASEREMLPMLALDSDRVKKRAHAPMPVSAMTPSVAKIAAAMAWTSLIGSRWASRPPTSTAGTFAIIIPRVVPATTALNA